MRAFISVVGLILTAVLLFSIAQFAITGSGLLWLRTFGVPIQNARTDITRQSNQYLTTKQTELVTLMQEHERIGMEAGQAGAAQRAAIIAKMRVAVATMEPGDVPSEVATFLTRNGGVR